MPDPDAVGEVVGAIDRVLAGGVPMVLALVVVVEAVVIAALARVLLRTYRVREDAEQEARRAREAAGAVRSALVARGIIRGRPSDEDVGT